MVIKRFLLCALLSFIGLEEASAAAGLPPSKPLQNAPELEPAPPQPTSVSGEKESGQPAPEIFAAETPASHALTMKALALEKKGDYRGIIELLRPASDTLSRRGLLTLARAYGARKDYLDQVKALELLSNRSEKDYYVLVELGEAYLRKADSEDPATRDKDLESAADQGRAAIDANKSYLPAYEFSLKILDRLEDRFEARSLLADMIKRFGPKPEYSSALCKLLSLDGYIDKALEVCKQAIDADPKNADDRVYLGLSLRDKEDDVQAEKILKKAASQFPRSEFAQWAAGQIAFDRKNYSAAYKLFIQGAKADPQAVRSWLGAGKSALELNLNRQSYDSFVAACRLDRQTQNDLRHAAGVLRSHKLFDWTSKFESALTECGTKQLHGG